MVIFPLAPDQTIAQMWSNRVRGTNCGRMARDSAMDTMEREPMENYHRSFKWYIAVCLLVTFALCPNGKRYRHDFFCRWQIHIMCITLPVESAFSFITSTSSCSLCCWFTYHLTTFPVFTLTPSITPSAFHSLQTKYPSASQMLSIWTVFVDFGLGPDLMGTGIWLL